MDLAILLCCEQAEFLCCSDSGTTKHVDMFVLQVGLDMFGIRRFEGGDYHLKRGQTLNLMEDSQSSN